jgi:hypothetical protein
MALAQAHHDQLEALATRILQHYTFAEPPVPVERILSKPPLRLTSVDISDLSLVFGTGERQYEYRLALGRLLYREILRDEDTRGERVPETGIDKDLPFSREAASYFAMALLLPAAWLAASTQKRDITLETLSARYQVSRDTMIQRIKQIGAELPASTDHHIYPQA